MHGMMALLPFWRSVRWASRLSLLVAGASMIAHVAGFAGMSFQNGGQLFLPLHLTVMALGFLLMARMLKHRREPKAVRLPRRLFWLTIVMGAYMAAWFFGVASHYGEGGVQQRDNKYAWVRGDSLMRTVTPREAARFESAMLIVASAVWMWFGL